MNEAQEEQLLLMTDRIAKHVDVIAATLVDEANIWHEYFRHLEAALALIADGVAPPVNEPDPATPPVLRTAERICEVIQDDITRMKAELAGRTTTRIENLETAVTQLVADVAELRKDHEAAVAQ